MRIRTIISAVVLGLFALSITGCADKTEPPSNTLDTTGSAAEPQSRSAQAQRVLVDMTI